MPGFIVCTLVAVLVSLFDRKPPAPVLERFAAADRDYRAAAKL